MTSFAGAATGAGRAAPSAGDAAGFAVGAPVGAHAAARSSAATRATDLQRQAIPLMCAPRLPDLPAVDRFDDRSASAGVAACGPRAGVKPAPPTRRPLICIGRQD